MLGLTLLLVACAGLAIAAGFTTALLRPDSWLDGAITLGVVAAAGAAAMVLLAGASKVLSPGVVVALEAAWIAASAALVARGGPSRLRPQWLERPRLRPSALRRYPWQTAIAIIAVLALAWQLLVALVLPPFAFDALTYHLTIVATWIQEGDVSPTPLSLCCAYYPANAELLFTWPVLFAGTDALVDTVQVGFAVLGALAVAGIARSAGLPAGATTAAAGLFAVTPAVLTQAPTNFADVMVAACALAALHSLTRFAATGAPQRLLVAGLATGLVLGTKGTGIIWAATLVGIAGILGLLSWRSGRVTPRTALAGTAAFLVACVALGGYWYARNWIDTGNPVYPFEARAAGVTVFEGPLKVDDVLTEPSAGQEQPRPVQVLLSWAGDIDFWRQGSYEYQQRVGGLGPLWPWLALPLLLPVGLALVRRRSPALILPIAVGVVLAVQPYAWWARFTIPLMGVGALVIAAAEVWAPRLWMRRAIGAAALALALAGVVLSSFEVDPAARAPQLAAKDLIGLIGAPQEERTVGRLFFPEYRFLEEVSEDATIIVDLRAVPVRFVYPLFGPEQSREVLPAGSGIPRQGAWHVTAAGRPLDRALSRDGRFRRLSAERGVHVWRPAR
jgi:hypothetical protein